MKYIFPIIIFSIILTLSLISASFGYDNPNLPQLSNNVPINGIDGKDGASGSINPSDINHNFLSGLGWDIAGHPYNITQMSSTNSQLNILESWLKSIGLGNFSWNESLADSLYVKNDFYNNYIIQSLILNSTAIGTEFLANQAGDLVIDLQEPNIFQPDTDGIVDLGKEETGRWKDLYLSGNVTADKYYGNGSQLTDIVSNINGTNINISTAEVINITANDITANNITANKFFLDTSDNNKLLLDASDNLNLQALNQLKLISGEDEIIWDSTALYPSASNVELGKVGNAWHGIYTADLITSQDIICGGSLLIGTGAAGVDYTLDFNGESNDAQIKWDEDGNYFRVNKGLWHFVPAGYTTDFTRYYDSGSVLRSYLAQAGTQKWTMQTGGVEKGNLQYTMPGGNIGIAVFNATGTARSEINFVQTGGIQLRASTTSSAGNIGLELNVSDDVKILNNLYVGKNLYVGGCIKYNGGTLGSCI